MTDTNKIELTPKALAKMHERATGWNPPARDQCIGEEHMARDVLELLDEVERLRADLEEALAERDRVRENADCIISGSLADHLAAAEVKEAIRDAFAAGARAAVAEIHGGDDLPANMDITKLPGRPEVRP